MQLSGATKFGRERAHVYCRKYSTTIRSHSKGTKQKVINCGNWGKKIITLFHLPACPLPGIWLSRGNISEHFSRSTCPVRQSSVTIWRALWHKVMLSSVRKLMSLLLSHCTPEEPGGRFIWAPIYAPRSAACPRETAGRRAAS